MSAAETTPRRRASLGRGLDALFGEADEADIAAAGAPESHRAPRSLPIEFLSPGPFQPRRKFDEAELDRLVESVKAQGVLQPILVRPIEGKPDRYHIIAGERRWRAAQKAKLHEVPVVVRPMSDRDAMQIAIIENVQRQDLTALEEAEGYQRLIADFTLTQEDVAQAVGKSRSHIANTLRLLDLPPDVQDMLGDRTLTAGVARSLLAFGDPLAMARRAVAEGLTVRDLERLAANEKKSRQPDTKAGATAARPAAGKTGDTKALERRIEEVLGLRADLQQTGKGEQCRLILEINDFDQLDTVVERLTRR